MRPQQTTGLFKNYADDSASFDEASGTALLASTVYRLALLAGVHTHLPLAEQCRAALSAPANSTSSPSSASSSSASSSSSPPASVSASPSPSSHNSTSTSTPTSTAPISSATAPASSSSSLVHFTADGWLQPVVNPYNVGAQGEHSPEGQAFVVEMYAAWRDWTALGSPGKNGAMGQAMARVGVVAGAVSLSVALLLS